MRASKKQAGPKCRSGADIHISGAECICDKKDLARVSDQLIKRAISHSRGKPDSIVITIEKINAAPIKKPMLYLKQIPCNTPQEAEDIICAQMLAIGISKRAISAAMRILRSGSALRGAVLMSSDTGRRLEPDRKRGVRVSRLGLAAGSEKKLGARLSALEINTPTVKEAIVLASKVAACKGIIAEICVSDDPDYTTGYIASKKLGYLRMPNIKNEGDMRGGRVFFINEKADVPAVIKYLQETPVLVEF